MSLKKDYPFEKCKASICNGRNVKSNLSTELICRGRRFAEFQYIQNRITETKTG